MDQQLWEELGSRKGHLSVCFKMREIAACLFAEEDNPVTWGEIDDVRER